MSEIKVDASNSVYKVNVDIFSKFKIMWDHVHY